MNKKIISIGFASIFVIIISITVYWFMIKSDNAPFVDLPPTFPDEAKEIVDATRKYIYDTFNPNYVGMPSGAWLTPAKCLEKAKIVVGVNGFRVFRSKWFFLNLNDKYIGIFDNKENDLISIAKLKKKGGKWTIYDYYLLPGIPFEYTKQAENIKNRYKSNNDSQSVKKERSEKVLKGVSSRQPIKQKTTGDFK